MTRWRFEGHRLIIICILLASALLAGGCDLPGFAELQGSPADAASSNTGGGERRSGEGREDQSTESDDRAGQGETDSTYDVGDLDEAAGNSDDAVVAPIDEGAQVSPQTSTTYGPRDSYDPEYDVEVPVGMLSQALIDAHPRGTRFKLVSGKHRLRRVLQPKPHQQFLGAPGAIISGAKVLTDWTRAGTYWYVSGQTQRLPITDVGGDIGSCKLEFPRCHRGEDVFLDGRLLRHVGSLEQVGPGKYYFDYSRDRIYIGDDPSTHVVEASVAPQGLASHAVGVVVRNLIIEMFGGHGQSGAVHGGGAPGWLLINCEVRLNHGIGAKISNGSVVGSYIHHNGKFGLAGSGDGNRVIGNEIAYNNTVGFDRGAGGSKWVFNDGLLVKDNWSHHNGGPGLWTDIDNINTVYENNRVTDNDLAGILHEVSYRATVRNNVIRRNGLNRGNKWWVAGAGVCVVNSPDVEVYDNVITDNAAGVMGRHNRARTSNQGGTHGLTELRNFTVRANTIRMSAGRTGIVSDSADTFSGAGNRFLANSYFVEDAGGDYWEWYRDRTGYDGSGVTWSEWRAFGHDAEGSLN